MFYPQPHKDLVYAAAYEHQIDPYLIFAIIKAESKYQNHAQSSVGARGLMQIMPETAVWIAQTKGIEDFEEMQLHDPKTNIEFGVWYLSSLNKEFDGKYPVILAAYNAGRGTVQKWLAEGIWDGDIKHTGNIPYSETKNYVNRVMQYYDAYRAIYDRK